MTRADLFPGLASWSPEPFIARLKAIGYTRDKIVDLPSFVTAPYMAQHLAIARAALANASDPFSVALKMFSLGDPVPLDSAMNLLGWNVHELVSLGLLEQLPGAIQSRYRVVPADDHNYYVSDFSAYQAEPRGDIVVGVSPAAHQLVALTPPFKPGARVLEAGCGMAWLSRRLAASGASVTATDINPRALDLARLNAVISGITSVDYRQGDFFDAVADEPPFDVIMCNPPYVVSPGGVLIYRETLGGESICKSIVSRAHRYLAPGGMAVVMLNWGHRHDADWADEPFSWCADERFQYWLNQSDCASPETYAWRWISMDPRYEGDDLAAAELSRWLTFYRAQGFRRISSGFMVIRRPADGTEPGWRRADSRAMSRVMLGAGGDISRVMLGETWLRQMNPAPDSLLDGLYDAPPGIQAVADMRLEAGWVRHTLQLMSPGRLSYDGQIDEDLMRLLELVKAGQAPRALVAEIRSRLGQTPPPDLEQRIATLVRELIRYGLLEPSRKMK